jgi:hypothetical protein
MDIPARPEYRRQAMTQSNKPGKPMRDPIEIWDDLLDLAAEDDAETGVATEDDAQWAQRLHADIKARLAELRRQHTPADVPLKYGVTIPAEIQAMNRQMLVAHLERLRQDPDVRYAHRDLTGLSDNDLRQMLAILVGPMER